MSQSAKPPELSAEQSRKFWQGAAFAQRFFMGLDEVHEAMRKLCAALEADRIPGAMALNAHGYQRVTTDVDVLFTTEGLASSRPSISVRGGSSDSPARRACAIRNST